MRRLLRELQNSIRAKIRARCPNLIFCKSPKAEKVISICKKSNWLCDHRILAAKRVLQFPLWLFLLFPLCLLAGTNDGSVLLWNDSSFILTATIQASDGTFLGQFSIQPGQQRNFTTNLNPTGYAHPGTPKTSLTPYTVIWQCPSEGYYSMCASVSPGSLCKANDCPGSHFCSPKQESKKEPPASTLKKTK